MPAPTMKKASAGILLLVALLALFPPPVEARVSATAALRLCVGTAADPTEPPGCVRKLEVDITVDRAQVAGTDADWRASLSTATDTTLLNSGSPDGEAGANSTAVVTFAPLDLSVTLGSTQQRYQLQYVREFSASATTEAAWNGALKDCASVGDACGSYTRVDGRFVPRSSGLCCVCAYCLLGDCTGLQIEPVCQTSVYGSLCLRLSPTTYSGYVLGPLSLWYTLDLSVRGGGLSPADGASSAVDFRLTTSTSVATAEVTSELSPAPSRAVLALLNATLSTSPSTQSDFSGHVFFVPSAPANGSLVAAGADEWMLLAPSLVTLDGSECGKVGISVEAWNALSETECMSAKGSCNGHQLADLRAEDAELLESGQSAKYLARAQGDFTRQLLEVTPGATPVDSLLGGLLATPTMRLSMVLSADVLDLQTMPAPGALVSTVAANTAYGATRNELGVTSRNSGNITSRFFVSVDGCTPGVTSLTAPVAVVLAAGQTTTTSFLAAQPTSATSRALSCVATLRDATNTTVLATRDVTWSTSARPPPSSDSGSNESVGARQRAMCARCTVTDFRCIWPNACLWQTFVWLVVFEAACFVCWLAARVFCAPKAVPPFPDV